MSSEPIETIDITEDDPTEQEVELDVEPSALDIDKIRQDEESKSNILMAAKLSQPVLKDELNKLQDRLSKLNTVGYKEEELKSIETYFLNVLHNVSNEQDRLSIITRRNSQIESKTLGLLALRVSAFNFAIDYNNGSNQQFDKFKEDLIEQKSKSIDEEIQNLTNKIEIKQNDLYKFENDLKLENERIEITVTKIIEDDENERIRVAKQKIEDLKTKKREEEERQYQEEIEEKQRLLNLKKQEELEEETRKRLANEELMNNLKNKGYSEETSLIIDENTKLPKLETDQLEQEFHKIKNEDQLNDDNDKIDSLQRKFIEQDKSGRVEYRALRAQKREKHAIRRQNGETNVSSDDEWIEEIDGKFSDEEDEVRNDTNKSDSDIDMLDTENEPFHVPNEQQSPRKQQPQPQPQPIPNESPKRYVVEPSPSYPIESQSHDLNPKPSYISDDKIPEVQPEGFKKHQHQNKEPQSSSSSSSSPSITSKPQIMKPATIPTKRTNPTNDPTTSNLFNRPRDPRVRKRNRSAVGHSK
ncbi:Cortactin-binding protein [Wickerhamomyces ciferrii]|uniref:Cortactin-binding protein n=1 Tax=Wickerhamomyces ciferrii (strain ATCC 14091 / BCRC 22168 / CBS 111 / JCM 3599 / NBRC 0793 / NRRL Y-1031 F-60-10) TaxID=1206466 RepID=K0KH91_WICCF|nr:Cortactin-binding protein [Wickerhamomyces ciferrii]CCH42366.1 Cortactin-binding protein [Wickerhamomyces ciferrii]